MHCPRIKKTRDAWSSIHTVRIVHKARRHSRFHKQYRENVANSICIGACTTGAVRHIVSLLFVHSHANDVCLCLDSFNSLMYLNDFNSTLEVTNNNILMNYLLWYFADMGLRSDFRHRRPPPAKASCVVAVGHQNIWLVFQFYLWYFCGGRCVAEA